MVRMIFCITLTLVVLASVGTLAQDAAPPTDSHVAAAMDLMEATNSTSTVVAVIDTMLPLALGQIRRQRPNLSADVINELSDAIRNEMVASAGDYVKAIAQLYVQHFSEDELRTLAQFYRSDTGKKYISSLPALIKETAPIGTAWGQAAGAKAIQAATARLRQKGINL